MDVDRHIFKRVTHFIYSVHCQTQDSNLKWKLITTKPQHGYKRYFGLEVNAEIPINKNLKIYDIDLSVIFTCYRDIAPGKVKELRLNMFANKIKNMAVCVDNTLK